MVPQIKLYKMGILNKIKTINYRFISNSFFTQSWLKKFNIESQVLYPFIESFFIDTKISNLQKEKIVLSVGRFFPQLHSKQHQKIIEIFKKAKQLSILPSDYKLILAGALKKEDYPYYKKLEELIKNNFDIVLKPNVPFEELKSLYQKASFFWHLTGFGIDETKNPEKVEHLGIAPLEAMASGCLTFCYNAGGPKEYIIDKENGFLFNNEKQLMDKIKYIFAKKDLQSKIQKNAYETIKNKFSYQTFKKRVKEILL
jgi:glycosyltransferase involved in cell wall biosynthesis